MTPEAETHLSQRCKIMRQLIRTHGSCTLTPDLNRPPFESLLNAVAHQQLNGKAAETILERFRSLFSSKRFPTAARIADVEDEDLRGCGFSRAKVSSIRDIAAKTLDGTIPSSRVIRSLSDEEIIERLIKVRGVGRWTVEMLLIFKLGRPNVLPADDFGVRSGFRIAFGFNEMPKPRDLLAYGERWRPYATTATWYLWRAADASKKKPSLS